MLSFDKLTTSCVRLAKQHQRLADEFNLFAAKAEEVLTYERFPVPNISFSVDKENRKFTAKMGGCPEVHFIFSAKYAENNALTGFVNCYVARPFEANPVAFGEVISFDLQGMTGERDEEDDGVVLSYGAHAPALVLRYLLQSISA